MEIEKFQTSFKNKDIDFRPYLITVVILISIILVIILFNNRLKDYYIGSALVKENKLELIVRREDLDKITTNKKIIIERNMFTYKVDKIDELTYGDSFYNQLVLSVYDLKEDLLVDNNVINFKIITDNTSIFEYLFKVVKGE